MCLVNNREADGQPCPFCNAPLKESIEECGKKTYDVDCYNCPAAFKIPGDDSPDCNGRLRIIKCTNPKCGKEIVRTEVNEN